MTDQPSLPDNFRPVILKKRSVMTNDRPLFQALILYVPTQLPANLQGPQGNIASKTIVLVGLVQWGVSRLYEITRRYSYSSTDLRTCMVDNADRLTH